MSTRRQGSNTSLSRYARATTPDPQNFSLDFCNSFWGLGDVGVEVLFARLRGATRTTEELKTFWKERAVIEEEYAKRLTKLAKATLGRDEINEMRACLDTIRMETEKQANFHQGLSQQLRTDLEAPVASFLARQQHHRKAYQAGIEKAFKAKQTQEAYVNKAREKYEADCVRINSYTAQSSLVQGKDLEKITLKLERAQQTVQANERDFANFAKALGETTVKWEQDWKQFCDSCQDLEEDRLLFMRDNMWAYANAVSTVCVEDDTSCEKVRLALENLESEKDVQNFVMEYGTGDQIPDPPTFVNYNTPDAIPSASSRPTTRTARFTRLSHREIIPPRVMTPPPPPEDEPPLNTAGVGAGGGMRQGSSYSAPPPAVIAAPAPSAPPPGSIVTAALNNRQAARNGSGALARQPSQVNGSGTATNSYYMPPSAAAGSSTLGRRSTSTNASASPYNTYRSSTIPDPHSDPNEPETFIKVGAGTFKVDPNKDPQMSVGPSSSRMNPSSPSMHTANDPLMKQLEDLKNVVSTTGTVRRSITTRGNIPQATDNRGSRGVSPGADPRTSQMSARSPTSATAPRTSSLSPPGTSSGSHLAGPSKPEPSRDYRLSAEMVVGAHPSVSRPASPQPPTAAFMVPNQAPGMAIDALQDVLKDYEQSLPGERKSASRAGSRRGSMIGHSPAQPSQSSSYSVNLGQGQNLARPPSVGHAGVGAHGSRSPSPQPISRGPSPAPGQIARTSYIAPPQPQTSAIARAPSPNRVGIALDANGRVMHDLMAQQYEQQQQQQHQHQHQHQHQQLQQHQQQIRRGTSPMPQQPPPPQQYAPSPVAISPQAGPSPQRRPSYMQPVAAPQPSPSPVGMVPPQPGYGIAAPPPQAGAYPNAPGYMAAPTAPYAPQPHQPVYQQPPPPQQPVQYQQPTTPYGSVNGLHRGPSANAAASGGYYQGQQQPVHPVQSMTSMASVPSVQQVAQPPPPPQSQPSSMIGRPPQHQQHSSQQSLHLHQPPPQNSYLAYRDPGSVSRAASPQPPPMMQPQPQQPQQHMQPQQLMQHQPPMQQPPPQPQQPQMRPQGQPGAGDPPILFYVKALYDYTATIDEEFDFQTGDVIAVTATPEDGWWSGMLLDEDRRVKGKHVFPSNFVCLF